MNTMLVRFFLHSFRYLKGGCTDVCRSSGKDIQLTEKEVSMLLPFFQFAELSPSTAIDQQRGPK